MLTPGGPGGSTGPFSHYPADSAIVRYRGDELCGSVATLLYDLGDGVANGVNNSLATVLGVLEAPLASSDHRVTASVRSLSGAAVFAGGAVRTFATNIETFDRGVDDLNRRWNVAAATDFGVASATYPADAKPAERASVDSARDDDVDAAGRALLTSLQREYARLEAALDDDADTVAGMLKQGPTEATVLTMYAAGDLPTAAPVAFTGYDFSKVSFTRPPFDMTPLQQATRGDYVALGDSYSSGEGAGDYLDDTDDDKSRGPYDDHENMCHRSANAYSGVLYRNNRFLGEYIFGACSGSVMSDYYNTNADGHDGEGPQRDHINGNTSLVTISMGGNDFGFAKVVESAVTGSAFEDPNPSTPQNESLDAKKAEIHALVHGDLADPGAPSLAQMYTDMRADAGPDARLVVVGYPRLFPHREDITNGGDSGISPYEQDALNELGEYVNTELAAVTRQSAANMEYVDISEALAGHEVGTDDPWIHDLDAGFGWPPVSSESFHPTAEGQDAVSGMVQKQLENGGR